MSDEEEKCRIALRSIRRDLAAMFGEKMAESVIRKQLSMNQELAAVFGKKMAADTLRAHISELGICLKKSRDVERLIDSLHENVFKKFVGAEKAEVAARKYRELLKA
ncbi:MAG: hypothetical protein QME59_07930 [Candidatus Hydrothermarchaeota archaeon]|nr:hypothetical protein [Candidatus Hydrothermarchaeota archaeon]